MKESEYILLADSGSTKTDWCVIGSGRIIARFNTQGINPYHQSLETVGGIISAEMLPRLGSETAARIRTVSFYGAGCRTETAGTVSNALSQYLPNATRITVDGDLVAAARAVCGNEPGIACILGTGANSCLYDGNRITANVPPLGYILGDEGSGAVLGRLFVNAMFKGDIPDGIRKEYLSRTHQTLGDIITRVYREPMANRYLAGMSPFIHEHLGCKQIERLVMGNFIDFFHRNVDHYARKDLKVGAVGSIAHHYKEQLEQAAALCGYRVGRIEKSPMDGLVKGMLEKQNGNPAAHGN